MQKAARFFRSCAVARLALLAGGLALLAGCARFQFPGVYKIDIQQGNVVTQEQVNQLQPGMTREQVRYILGTPLITDTFNRDRWDYVYSLREGHADRAQERLTVIFDGNRLAAIEGDFRPGQAAIDDTTPGAD